MFPLLAQDHVFPRRPHIGEAVPRVQTDGSAPYFLSCQYFLSLVHVPCSALSVFRGACKLVHWLFVVEQSETVSLYKGKKHFKGCEEK